MFSIFTKKQEKGDDNSMSQEVPIITSPSSKKSHIPLAEKMRPNELVNYIGQTHLIGPKTLLYNLLKNGEIPNMILWGPPGCGKTSLINVILQESKKCSCSIKFIKLSATSAGTNDVKKALAEAEIQLKQGRKTVVFMDEIHRFNKLQQDVFLPHVEEGKFTLIGATTENPSFGLNSALLSRCRVFILKKLNSSEISLILIEAVKSSGGVILSGKVNEEEKIYNFKFTIDQTVINWLAEISNGDARVALGALEVAIKSKDSSKIKNISKDDIKSSLQKPLTSEDEKENIHHLYSALHRCILASKDSPALYWLARIMATGEDPVCIARKLILIANEDIGLTDEDAFSTAAHTLHACQMIGMPECDVMLAQCVIYLSRAEKSREVTNAFGKALDIIENHKGPQPKVPLFIKDTSAQGKLRASLKNNYTQATCQENRNKNFLPDGLEDANFFSKS